MLIASFAESCLWKTQAPMLTAADLNRSEREPALMTHANLLAAGAAGVVPSWDERGTSARACPELAEAFKDRARFWIALAREPDRRRPSVPCPLEPQEASGMATLSHVLRRATRPLGDI